MYSFTALQGTTGFEAFVALLVLSAPLRWCYLIGMCVWGLVYICLCVWACTVPRAPVCICGYDWWQKSSLLNVLLTVTQWDLHNHHNQLMCACVGWFQGQHGYVSAEKLTLVIMVTHQQAEEIRETRGWNKINSAEETATVQSSYRIQQPTWAAERIGLDIRSLISKTCYQMRQTQRNNSEATATHFTCTNFIWGHWIIGTVGICLQ